MKITKILYNSACFILCVLVLIKISSIACVMFGQALAPPGADDPSIATTLATLVANDGYVPDIGFLQEYAPGFHYVAALILKIFGGGTPALNLGVSVLGILVAPALFAVLAALVFRKLFWVLAVLAVYYFTGPWVGIKGIFLLATLAVLLSGNPTTLKFHFKAGIAIGLLMGFAQEFALYIGYAFALYTWLCACSAEISSTKARLIRFIRMGAVSFCGFSLVVAPVLVFYATRGGLSDLILYMFQISLGPQAHFMKLPFCFDCGPGVSALKTRAYLIPFLPIFGCALLTCVPRDRQWMKVALLVLAASTTLITGLGRSIVANIMLGGLPSLVLLVYMIANVRHCELRRDIVATAILASAFVVEILIISYSETLGFFQLAVVAMLGVALARHFVPASCEPSPHANTIPVLSQFSMAGKSLRYSGKIGLYATSAVLTVAVLATIFLWGVFSQISNDFRAVTHGGWATFIEGVQQFRSQHASWARRAMAADEVTGAELIDYVSRLPGDEIFVFPRSAALYIATGKKNPTRIYMFARYFAHTSEVSRLLATLEGKKLEYIVVEEDLAARCAAPVYWYILEHYAKEKQIGSYAIYRRTGKPADQIILTRVIEAFAPETTAKEYIWANYLKERPVEKPQFSDFLFQHPPHARCIVWNHEEWLAGYRQLDITWAANPDSKAEGDVSISRETKNGWETIAARHVGGSQASSTFTITSLADLDCRSLKFCTELPSGSYLKIVAIR
jgi:hypothetical protein